MGKRIWHAVVRSLSRIFVWTVLIPTFLAVLYYGVIASDVYISEARFMVKAPKKEAQGTLNELLVGTGFARASDDSYAVHDYMLSRDAMAELEKRLKVREAYSRPDIDVFNRFGLFGLKQSWEQFYLYYLNHVELDYDNSSSITTVYVRAFDPKEARAINEVLLDLGEQLVNKLNERSRNDIIQSAEREVRKAEARDQTAAAALAAFRSQGGLFDPQAQSALQLQTISRIEDDLRSAQAQLARLRQVSPDNPQVAVLKAQIAQLERSLTQENAKVTGRSSSLSSKSPAFDRLVLEKSFADRQLAGALASLDDAKEQAQNKQLYLERLVEPNLPDEAVEPRRLRSIFTVFILGLAAWGMVSLVTASIREHMD